MNQDMPLAMVVPGELVTVTAVRDNQRLKRRLADMGLTLGVQIKVVNGQMCGPVLIDLRGSMLALGRGIAQKITVRKV